MQLIQSLARGGAERLTLELSLGLREAGHDTLVVTLIDENAHDEPEYASVASSSLLSGKALRWPWYLPRAASRLKAVVQEWKPDLLLIHTQNVAVVAALAVPMPPVIQVVHSYWEAMPGTPCAGVAPPDARADGRSDVSGAGASSLPSHWSKTRCVTWVAPRTGSGASPTEFGWTGSRSYPATRPPSIHTSAPWGR